MYQARLTLFISKRPVGILYLYCNFSLQAVTDEGETQVEDDITEEIKTSKQMPGTGTCPCEQGESIKRVVLRV